MRVIVGLHLRLIRPTVVVFFHTLVMRPMCLQIGGEFLYLFGAQHCAQALGQFTLVGFAQAFPPGSDAARRLRAGIASRRSLRK